MQPGKSTSLESTENEAMPLNRRAISKECVGDARQTTLAPGVSSVTEIDVLDERCHISA